MLHELDFDSSKRLVLKGSKLASKIDGVEVDRVEPIYEKTRHIQTLVGVSSFYSAVTNSQMSKIADLVQTYLNQEENDSGSYVRDAHDIKGKKIGGKKSVVVRGRYSGRRTEIFITPEATPKFRRKRLPKTIAGFCDQGRRRENVSISYKDYTRRRLKRLTAEDLLPKRKNTYDVEVRSYKPTSYDLIQRPLIMGTLLSNAELIAPGKRYAMTLEALLQERQKEVKWSDLGGYEKLRTELMTRLGGPILNPALFEGLNLKPSSILLTGAPGTGKTMISNILVNTLDGCCRIPFKPDLLPYSFAEKAHTSKFFEWLDEVGEETGQTVYLFYDEFEDIGNRFEGNKSQVTNEVLRALDGSEDHYFHIFATSNKPSAIDPAMFRPGRMHPVFYLSPPDKDDRYEILGLYAKLEPNYNAFDISKLAELTNGHTGAHLKNIFDGAKIDEIIRLQVEGDKELDSINKDDVVLTQEKIEMFIKKTATAIKDETNKWDTTFRDFRSKLGKGTVLDAKTGKYID